MSVITIGVREPGTAAVLALRGGDRIPMTTEVDQFGMSFITFDRNNLQVIPYKDPVTGEDRLLIKPDNSDAYGLNLEDFTEPLIANSECPVSLKWLRDNRMFSYERDGHRIVRRCGQGWNNSVPLLIARVLHGPGDSCRAIYLTNDSPFPDFVVTQECVGYDTYSRLDPGMFVRTSNYHVLSNVTEYLEQNALENMLPTRAHKADLRGKVYCANLEAHKRSYMQAYFKKRCSTCYVGIFKVESKKFIYSDTVVETATRADANKLAEYLLGQYERDFTQLLKQMIMATGLKLKVNGCAIQYKMKVSKGGADLHYVNGKKISHADLFEVIEHSTCYPDRGEAYQAYVDQVSSISLKFHTAISRGLPLVMQATSSIAGLLSEGESLPTIGGSSQIQGSRVSTGRVMTRIRKPQAHKHAEVFLLGEWRKIINFDMYMSRSTSESWNQRNSNYCTTSPSYGMSHEMRNAMQAKLGDSTFRAMDRVAARLVILDNFLEPEDRILKKYYRPAPESFRADEHRWDELNVTNRNLKGFMAICKQFAEGYQSSIQEELDMLKKSKENLDSAVKRTSTEVIERHSKHKCRVYRVTGASGMRYDIREDDAAVYDAGTDSHICIVKASNQLTFGYDYIISLINSLAQDRFTARNIYTVNNLLDAKGKKEAVES